jgi:hypothetical protein
MIQGAAARPSHHSVFHRFHLFHLLTSIQVLIRVHLHLGAC